MGPRAVTLAVSSMTTKFVMWCTSGRVARTRSRCSPRASGSGAIARGGGEGRGDVETNSYGTPGTETRLPRCKRWEEGISQMHQLVWSTHRIRSGRGPFRASIADIFIKEGYYSSNSPKIQVHVHITQPTKFNNCVFPILAGNASWIISPPPTGH